jgi:hypothetical protein
MKMNLLRKSWRAVAVIFFIGAMTMGLSTAAHASTLSPAGRAVPLGLTSVDPTNSCGAFSGKVAWTETPGSNAGTIHIYGDLWNNACPAHAVYLFVNYTLVPGGPYEYFSIGSARYSKSANVKVDWNNSKSDQNFSGIAVRVCDNSTGTDCGGKKAV